MKLFAQLGFLVLALSLTPAQANTIESQLEALWTGNAVFQETTSFQIPTHGNQPNAMNAGTQIVPFKGKWYLFNREYEYTARPDFCKSDFARIVVRYSTDKGKTWSNKQVVAEPNLAASECAILDGHAFYDEETSTWQYIAQFLTSHGKWGVSHFTKAGDDPYGKFVPNAANPVIDGRRPEVIFGSICGPGKACPKKTHSPGTPEIIYKKDGYYFVTFHGAHARNIWGDNDGYRVMAKTADFRTWITQADDLPGDAIWSSKDCQGWNVPWSKDSGCIGGGAANTLITQNYTYMLIESADLSLGCTDGQRWMHGLVRAPRVVKSGQWEHLPMNPILDAGSTVPCSVQYARLFVDEDTLYLGYWTMGATKEVHARSFFHIVKLVPRKTIPETIGKVEVVRTTFSTLRAYHKGCFPIDPSSSACTIASSRYCSVLGYSDGFGPVEHDGDIAVLWCKGLKVDQNRIENFESLFSELSTKTAQCTAKRAKSGECRSAVHRTCVEKGFTSGYGVFDQNKSSASYSCIR